jgi:hypothetical protein
MKQLSVTIFIIYLLSIYPIDTAHGWGFRSHRNIHRAAVSAMPEEIKYFFANHSEFLIEESVRPDTRRSDDPTEGPNHYVNLDRFGEYPFEDFPLSYDAAIAQYGEETLESYGFALWRIQDWYDSLVVSMRNQDRDRILRYAADLGHYVADIHMPLHTTSNYDGQRTGQRGVHRRFETELPARYDSLYQLTPEAVNVIENPLEKAFTIALDGYRLIDALYAADLRAQEGIPEDQLYTIEERNGRRYYVYHETYYRQFHDALGGMVENRLQMAAQHVRDFWYSAWIKAGKPELPG